MVKNFFPRVDNLTCIGILVRLAANTERYPMTNAIQINRGPGRPRSDSVGDFLRWVEDQKKTYEAVIDDALLTYSHKNGLLWHLGWAEYRSALAQVQQRLRVELVALPESEAGKGDGRRATLAGEFNFLLGTKLFPADRYSGKSTPLWCLGVPTRPRVKATPDGMRFPNLIELIRKADSVGDTEFTTNSAAAREIAKMPKRKRDIMIADKNRNYRALMFVQSDLEESNGKNEKQALLIEDLNRELTGYNFIASRRTVGYARTC